jgi:hypothetical protein
MSAQFKLEQPSHSDQVEKTQIEEKNLKQRPNIDHLLKRISIERQQEKRTNLIILALAVLGICVGSFIFTQI